MKKIGLKAQVAIGCLVFTFVLTAAIGISGYLQYKENITRKYHDYARTIIELAEDSFIENDMLTLVKYRSMGASYDKTRKVLNTLKENSDIAYIFGIYFEDITDTDSLCFVINGATSEDLAGKDEHDVYSYMGEKSSPGDFDEPMRNEYLSSFMSGSREVHYYENYTAEYGLMLTCYKVLHDEYNKPICILSVDMDENDIRQNLHDYITRMMIIAFFLMLILLVSFVGAVDRFVTDPVINLARSSNHFINLLQNNTQPEKLIYKDVNEQLSNEIGMLSHNVKQMAVSITDYMINLQSVTKERERIGAELELATQIQADLLPRIFPPYPGRDEFVIYGSMTPAKEVGGDFYDFFFVDENHFAMVIADVSGKGVPAALFMVIAKTLIKNQVQMTGLTQGLGRSLAAVNDQLCEGNDAELFVTVWLAMLDLRTGEGTAVNAGHEHPALQRKDGSFELVKYHHSPAVATIEGLRFREHTFQLYPGDKLFVYTDGVTEATNAGNELFGEQRLVEALNENPAIQVDQLPHHIKNRISGFVADAPQFDDITMLSFEYIKKTDGN